MFNPISNFRGSSDILPRRRFLTGLGSGVGSIALSSLLFRDAGSAETKAQPPAAAKRVIWLFMLGGTSHMEGFDPKPALDKYGGKTIDQTPYASVVQSHFTKQNVRLRSDAAERMRPKLLPLQVGYKKRGESGIEISDWWPEVGGCVDDMTIVRSLWTTDANHTAQVQFHTGRHHLDGPLPTLGSWVHYGLASGNENLPEYVVLGSPMSSLVGGDAGYRASFLGPQYDGIRLDPSAYKSPAAPTPSAAPQQKAERDLLQQFQKLAAAESPDDLVLRARIRSYELAFRMQSALPEALDLSKEPNSVRRLYGIGEPNTSSFGELCLSARRLAERGVRFVQVFHGDNGTTGKWDGHVNLKTSHAQVCAEVDLPIAGLLRDLKRTGLLKDTLVVWATEFGRTPGSENDNGRDHHVYGFSAWMAGGGIKGGVAHGRTDEIGFHAVEDRHYLTDLHATVMRQLGLDPRRLEIPGHKRLESEFGEPIKEIIA